MVTILVIMAGISRNQFKCSYLKSRKKFRNCSLGFLNLHEILNILNKISDSERHVYLIFEKVVFQNTFRKSTC